MRPQVDVEVIGSRSSAVLAALVGMGMLADHVLTVDGDTGAVRVTAKQAGDDE